MSQKTLLFICCIVVLTTGLPGKALAMSAPSSQQVFSYAPVDAAQPLDDPAAALPIGVGSIADSGSLLSLQLALPSFTKPVDVYFAIAAAAIAPGQIFVVTPSDAIQSVSQGIVPWKSNTLGPVNEKFFGDIPVSAMPSGTYTFYVVVTPAGSQASYFIWETSVTIQTDTQGAAQFLLQAAFGPTSLDIDLVRNLGFSGYLNRQFSMAVTPYPSLPFVDPNVRVGCPIGSASTCYRDSYSSFPVQNAFFRNALTAPDQLRQRVAFALGQIFVVSNDKVTGAYAIREYQQMLADNAFGNFRTLLQKVTLSPAMGDYLHMANNDKANPALGTEPNQNYAREILQLFSIGLVKLNPDGTVQVDGQGNPIPTYDQSVIEGFSQAFTGWTYPTHPGVSPKAHNPRYYVGDMIPVAADHDTGTKTLLNGIVLPINQTPEADLQSALDVIFAHPNVGPFIGKQLIQFLVTSNPSPAYVARVAAAFSNNGNGVRGDMKAVISAVLLDPEARASLPTPASFGQLRDPAVFIASLLRAFGASSDGVAPNRQSAALEQAVFNAPSVFNFYPSNYPLPGVGNSLIAPQFGILNTTSVLTRWNFLNSAILNNALPDSTVPGATGTHIDWSAWLPLAANPDSLISALDLLISGGALNATSRAIVRAAVEAVPASNALYRVRTAAYLIAGAAQTMIQR